VSRFTTKSTISAAIVALLSISGCSRNNATNTLPPSNFVAAGEAPGPDYVIGPLDNLSVFVWRNPELSTTVRVRPDGRVTFPLIDDLPATGQTPTQLAKAIEEKLRTYIQNPIVSVIVSDFRGPFAQQVRVVGEAAKPAAIPYQANMTLLDVMIAVGGLTDFAAGNRARLIRFDPATGSQKEYKIKIDRLLKDGDVKSNVAIRPGDTIIIPESFF
jgi:polysaccharide biosynthesis/export protein